MARYFKNLKDNFLWAEGAILSNEKETYQYVPIKETTIWDNTDRNNGEYISSRIIENNPNYFVEVYPVNLLTKTIYKVKEEARALMAKDYDS